MWNKMLQNPLISYKRFPHISSALYLFKSDVRKILESWQIKGGNVKNRNNKILADKQWYLWSVVWSFSTYKTCNFLLFVLCSHAHTRYLQCRLCLWCFISWSRVSVLSWVGRQIFLSVSSLWNGAFELLTISKKIGKICNTNNRYVYIFSSCRGCNRLSQCCNSYEYCVSCCLNPSKVISLMLPFSFLFFSFHAIFISYDVITAHWNLLCRHCSSMS